MTYTLEQLHGIYCQLLMEFDVFCRTNGISYMLDGGTLLGAVRDGQFIPWDDDVDIAMPRPDYDRFIKIWKGNMVLKCHELDASFFFPYAKLLCAKTPIISLLDKENNTVGDVFVQFDIYPIDGAGNDEKGLPLLAKRIKRLKQLLYYSTTKIETNRWYKKAVYQAIKLFGPSFYYYLLQKEMRYYDYSNSQYVTRWRMPDLVKTVYPKNQIVPFVNISFCGLSLLAPQNADLYLMQCYGDYKTPRRENEGLRHEISNSEITEQLAKRINR